MVGADLLAVALSFHVASVFDPTARSADAGSGAWTSGTVMLSTVVAVVATLGCLGAYRSRPRLSVRDDLVALTVAALVAGTVGALVVHAVPVFIVTLLGFLVVLRHGAHSAVRSVRRPRTVTVLDSGAGRCSEQQHPSRAALPPATSLARPPHGRGRSRAWSAHRACDVVLAGTALLLLAPVLAVVAIAVRVEVGRGVLVRQTRLSSDGWPVTVLMFRSVRPRERPGRSTGWSLDGRARLGPVGRFLRSTSIEELPQLVSVLRGDLSLSAAFSGRSGRGMASTSSRSSSTRSSHAAVPARSRTETTTEPDQDRAGLTR